VSRKISMEIPDDIFTEIDNFKKRVNITDDNVAICELIKYVLTLPPYFKNFDWEKAESEADADIEAGRVKSFTSLDDFLADLKA